MTRRIDLSTVQARRDQQLRAQLGADPGVVRALIRLNERMAGYGYTTRRRLLTGALRLTRNMAPEVLDALTRCREVLNFDRPIELYVRPEPVFNAFCVQHPGGGPILIGLSSHLLEAFEPAELQFVLGHELGHVLYDHFALPMPHLAMIEDLAGKMVSREVALDLSVWSRAAELSADRIGLLCTQDAKLAAQSFFKLASGVASSRIKPDLSSFASQLNALASAPEARSTTEQDDNTQDCFATHPYSPVRVRALVAFARSQNYQRAIGRPTTGIGDDELNRIIDRDLDLMSPTYLQEQGAQAEMLRDILYRSGLVVAHADGHLHDKEVSALRTLLGDLAAHKVENVDLQSVQVELQALVERARADIPLARRAGLVSHLTIIAAADGVVDDAELEQMTRIAVALGVNPTVIDQTLAGAASPMD